MSFTKQYAFVDPNNYTFDSDLIEFTESQKPRLKLSNNPGQDFVEDFADDTGHVYDSNAAEFVGGKYQQKDKQLENSQSWATYDNTIDLTFGPGTLTGNATNGASISGNRLDLAHSDVRYVDYVATNNIIAVQTGAIRFKYTPNYSGSPTGDRTMLYYSGTGNNNLLFIRHKGSGQLQVIIYNSSGVSIITVDLGAWSPTASTTYEMELNYDITVGATRLFVDGIQFGSTQINTGTRNSAITDLRVGSNVAGTDSSNFYIEDLIFFDTVQHTTNYTPGYTLEEYKYIEGYDTLPEMEYTGAGTLISFDSLTYTLTGSAKIALQIGRSGVWSYWNGATWATGDGTKDYMCSFSDFAANVGTLDIEGEIYGQFKIYFPDSNSQGDIDILTASLTAQIYSTANPTIEFEETITHEGLESFIETSTKTGSDEIKYILKKGSTNYYYNTVNEEWTESDGTYSQANTAVEIETNKATFTTIGVIMTMIAFLHSDDGTTTPLLTQVDVNYDFYSFDDTDTTKCLVYGWVKDENENPVENATVTAVPSVLKAIYGNNVNAQEQKSDTTDSNGYWEIELLESVTNGVYYTFYFYYDNHTEAFEKLVPNETSKKFGELEDIS
jgi:hypothetical protein